MNIINEIARLRKVCKKHKNLNERIAKISTHAVDMKWSKRRCAWFSRATLVATLNAGVSAYCLEMHEKRFLDKLSVVDVLKQIGFRSNLI